MLPVNESDWKLFRKRLPEWQERCMEQLAESYAALLAGPGKASDKFWELEKRLRKDKKRVGVVADVSRSEMYYNLLYLLDDKTITLQPRPAGAAGHDCTRSLCVKAFPS